MAPTNEQSYRLLQDEDKIGSRESFDMPQSSCVGHKKHQSIFSISLKILLFLSFLTNVLLISLFIFVAKTSNLCSTSPEAESQYVDVSPYAGLARQPSYKFPYSTGYGPLEATNHSYADEIWEAIDIDPGIIAVPVDWAEENNLAETQVFPWDHSKGLYVVNAFHSIHCLKILHRLVYDAHHGRPLSREVEHAMHCIDHMRKDAMCNADDFLLPTPPHRQGNPGPRGQSRVCKNFDALVGWAKERNACYQHITDDEVGFANEHHEIERYLHCKPDSPYYEKMRQYVDSEGEILQLPSVE